MNALSSKFALAAAMSAGLALAGCATSPYGSNGSYNRGYPVQQDGYGDRNVRCQTCGVVQEVQQVYIDGDSGNGGTLGAIIGAVAGGVLGNQVGGGKGKTLATVAGAVGGGYAGNRIQASRQPAQVSSTVERKCETVNNTSSKIVGYDVRYEYNGVTRTVRMDHDPGDRVQVQEGVTAVSDAH